MLTARLSSQDRIFFVSVFRAVVTRGFLQDKSLVLVANYDSAQCNSLTVIVITDFYTISSKKVHRDTIVHDSISDCVNRIENRVRVSSDSAQIVSTRSTALAAS